MRRLHAAIALIALGCGPGGVPPDAAADSGAGVDGGADAGPRGPFRSALYPEDWEPGTVDGEGRGLADFSYAGYRHGEAEPGAEVSALRFDVTAYGADPTGALDATGAIAAAIAEASVGGGVVLFPEGLYRVDGLLRVEASGVVLRGEGPSRSRLWLTASEGMSQRAHVTFHGELTSDLELPLVEDGARFARHVLVADAADLAVGDDVDLGWVVSEAFVADHGMTGVWQAFNDTWQPFARRTVVAIDASATPARVELDVPLRSDALVRDGASLRRTRGHLREVGFEGLGLANAVAPDAAWAETQVHALEMTGVADGWIRDVASFPSPGAPAAGEGAGAHLASCGLLVRASKRVTVDRVHLAEVQNRGPGGNGYLFEVRASNEVLFRDCTGRAGRHNFIQNWGFGTSGCVWLRVQSEGGRAQASRTASALFGPSELHHSLATANLIDSSVLDDGWLAVNRLGSSSGAGHTGTENVFWGTTGRGQLRSFQFSWGYVIATGRELRVTTDGVPWEQLGTEPLDWLEGEGRAEDRVPSSLYEDQLARRLAR